MDSTHAPSLSVRALRLNVAYLLTVPALLLSALLSSIAFCLVCNAENYLSAVGFLFYLPLSAIGIFSAVVYLYRFTERKTPLFKLILAAILLYAAAPIPFVGLIVCIPCYLRTLRQVRQQPSECVKPLLKRFAVVAAAIVLLFSVLLFGLGKWLFADHYYETPKIGRGMDESELLGEKPTQLIELENGQTLGVYESAERIGFALFSVKKENGKRLYCYRDDTGYCYPVSILEGDEKGYAETVYYGEIKRSEMHPWGEWKALNDRYRLCLIPGFSSVTPEAAETLLFTQTVTLNGRDFRLYVASR